MSNANQQERVVKPDSSICYFGGTPVGQRMIGNGLYYMDCRGKLARVNDNFEGIVVLDWLDSGKQSQCSERGFRSRFYLYGNGHDQTV